MECSLREHNETNKILFITLALGRGCGLLFKRESGWFLSIDESNEFRIPNNYSVKEHNRLTELLQTQLCTFEAHKTKMLLSIYLLPVIVVFRLLMTDKLYCRRHIKCLTN